MTLVTEWAGAVDKYRYQSRPVKTLNWKRESKEAIRSKHHVVVKSSCG